MTIWNKKLKNEKINDKLYLITAKFVDIGLNEKALNFVENLNIEKKTSLQKFFYTCYERCGARKECGLIKPTKIFATHQKVIADKGKGQISRALFSIQK